MTYEKYLVWVRFNGTLSPQVWFHAPYKPMESDLNHVVMKLKVPEEHQSLTLGQLAAMYPAPKEVMPSDNDRPNQTNAIGPGE